MEESISNTWSQHAANDQYFGRYLDLLAFEPYSRTYNPPAWTCDVSRPSEMNAVHTTSYPGQIPLATSTGSWTRSNQQSYRSSSKSEMQYFTEYSQYQAYIKSSLHSQPELYAVDVMPHKPTYYTSRLLHDEPSYRSSLEVPVASDPPAGSGSKAKKSVQLKHTCGVCFLKFATRSEYSKHVRAHHGEKKTYTCKLCAREFRQKSSLYTHHRIHTGDKPFQCTHCEKSFSDHSSYTKHLRIHTGEKPYTCTHCGKAFAQSGNLKRHVKAVHK